MLPFGGRVFQMKEYHLNRSCCGRMLGHPGKSQEAHVAGAEFLKSARKEGSLLGFARTRWDYGCDSD